MEIEDDDDHEDDYWNATTVVADTHNLPQQTHLRKIDNEHEHD
jgi:hypothetical protein